MLKPSEWQPQGRCVNLPTEQIEKIFFYKQGGSPNNAKLICGGCSVKYECLSFAILYNQEGVWGGTTQEERSGLAAFMKPALQKEAKQMGLPLRLGSLADSVIRSMRLHEANLQVEQQMEELLEAL